MVYVEEDQGPEHAVARDILAQLIDNLQVYRVHASRGGLASWADAAVAQDGEFDACIALAEKATQAAEAVVDSAPGLAGKVFGNLSSAYVQLRRYDAAIKMTQRHLEVWKAANHLPEQHSVLQAQLNGYKAFDGQDITYLLQDACSRQDWGTAVALRERIWAYMHDPGVDKGWCCEMANNLGLVYLQLEDVAEAKGMLTKALSLAQEVGAPDADRLIASTQKNLARVQAKEAAAGTTASSRDTEAARAAKRKEVEDRVARARQAAAAEAKTC